MAANKYHGGPAFPAKTVKYLGPAGGTEITFWPGMSLRDWFAGMAMQAFASRTDGRWVEAPPCAYQLADAMLAERAEESESAYEKDESDDR